MQKRHKFIFAGFIVLWLLINIIQAIFTDLAPDEAYYRAYSKFLDWGYFDHPPMIALFVRSGSFIANELGVRMFTIISQAITLMLIFFYLIEHQDKNRYIPLFFTLAISIPVLHVYAFTATPDSPLLFFSAIYLIAYKQFTEKQTLAGAFFLGLSMALLLYSKYHGVLLLAFTLLSNLRLLRKPLYYMAALFGMILFVPHLYWQYINEFPSLKYHLIERSSNYVPFYSIEFLLNLFVTYNPYLIVILIISMFRKKAGNTFERSLHFTITGFVAFFFISSIRGHVQPQWLIIITIPLVILLFHEFIAQHKKRKIFYYTLFLLVPLLLLFRVEFIFGFLPTKPQYGKNTEYNRKIEELAENRPVMFLNLYQNASLYWYYSAQDTLTSLGDYQYRGTQYDIWDFEDWYKGKDVLLVGNSNSLMDSVIVDNEKLYYRKINNYMPLDDFVIDIENYTHTTHSVKLDIILTNPYNYDVHIADKNELYIRGIKKCGDKRIIYFNLSETVDILILKNCKIRATIEVSKSKFDNNCRLGLSIARKNFVYPCRSLIDVNKQ